MLIDVENDHLSYLIQTHPEFDVALQKILEENKQTNSMFVHELRNPLSLMKGTLQYIELKHPETKDFKYWSQLHELVADLENMMADASLLNTCNTLSKSNCNFIEIISAIKDHFMPQAISQNIELTLEVKGGCEEYFSSYYCDAPKMKQVIWNLIKNALEASSSGNFIHIKLDFKPETDHNLSKLLIDISDNGAPIPEDEIDTIFTPFVTYKKGGTGVGLAIVKRIIELHYGSIHVTSNPSLTSFLLQLPLISL